MSKRAEYSLPSAPAADRPPIWRSLKEKADPVRYGREAAEEKSIQQTIPEKSIVGRRQFLAVSGATAAAVGLSGCLRRPAENILPYSRAPEYSLPGIALHFATSVSHRGEPIGLLVESHEGRPTKIEGLPEEAGPMGAELGSGGTDAQLQALILDLYDDDRSAHLLRKTGSNMREQTSWAEFDSFWREKARELGANGGRGLRILMEPTDSPSVLRARRALAERFPQARVHTYSAVGYSNIREGARLAFGAPVTPIVDFGRARTILSIDCDFLGDEPGSIRNQRRFANGRRVSSPASEMNRLYVVEGTLSLTGANADHRLRIGPSKADAVLRALAAALGRLGVAVPAGVAQAAGNARTEGIDTQWIEKVARDLAQGSEDPSRRAQSVVVVGWRQPPHVHALAHAINGALGSLGNVVNLTQATDAEEPAHVESLRELTEAMRQRQVDTLVILGGNPAYDAPSDLGFAAALENVPTSIHLSSMDDETSFKCTWHLPRAHALESWGDHRAPDGTLSIQQPLIAPLRGGRSEQEVFAQIAGIRGWRGYHLVRNTMRELVGAFQFENAWRRGLHAGRLTGGPTPSAVPTTVRDADVGAALTQAPIRSDGWDAVFVSSYQVGDGRFASNAWLLELPDPITKIVWDNAALISPASARELGVENGDMLELSRDGVEALSVPAFIVPGHADRVVTLPLGFGRERAGRRGSRIGFDVYPFRTTDAMGFATGVSVRKGAGSHNLVHTQEHHSMTPVLDSPFGPLEFPERPLAIDATLAEYREQNDFAQWRTPTPQLGPLWTQVDYRLPQEPAQGGTSYSLIPEQRQPRPGAPPRYKWSMIVDLSTCTGCSACVIACQAENNIAVVGKRQVEVGREMHWMRLDRYFVGNDENEPRVAVQPMMCQHCEEAPCENVCPVNATVHSPEGLNEMAYNRCIGTRYCMNNCPYKVRRFNFLDWHGEIPEVERMRFNPNVTVRMRGVMEKCTYCVQRIQTARVRARVDTKVRMGDDGRPVVEEGRPVIDERRIEDREVTPACAQACPSGAILFGDLNAPNSLVARLAELDRHYKVLAAIGTQPRTTYLGKIRNPNPELV